MFKIAPSANVPDNFEIHFNNEFIAIATYCKPENIIENDEYVKFELEQLYNIAVADYPDNFHFKIETPHAYLEYFHLFNLRRIGNGMVIEIYASFDIMYNTLNYLNHLLWNPRRLADEAHKIAEQKGFEISKYAYENNNEFAWVSFTFYFPVKVDTTLGNLLNIVLNETAKIMTEAEMILFNEAAKKREKGK
jgi:hypothetical protein